MKHALAVITALAVGFIVVGTIEFLGHFLFPLPEGFDATSPEYIRANFDSIPLGSLIFVAIAHFFGMFGAIATAKRMASTNTPAYIAAGVFALATVLNLIMIPHPVWFMVLDIAAIIAGAYIGCLIQPHIKEVTN